MFVFAASQITTAQNVGIDEPNPTEKLDVNGRIKAKGYKILEQSRRSPQGELDLIALDGRTIVFVEVKTRATTDPHDPVDGVTQRKRQQLTRLGLAYLKQNGLLEHSARFDIVGINWPRSAKEPAIRHYVNAFEPTGRWQMYS